MFTKMKQNMAKKGLIAIWLIITTLYTIHGVYNYFKYSVYQAGAQVGYQSAVLETMSKIKELNCSQPLVVRVDETEMSIVDAACPQ